MTDSVTHPTGDALASSIGWGRPVLQIRMNRLESVAGVEAALAPVFDALHTPEALAVFEGAVRLWDRRVGFGALNGRNGYGISQALDRLSGMASESVGWKLRGPQAQAPAPVDPSVSGDAAWCARALACMVADWGLADTPNGRADATAEIEQFLADAVDGDCISFSTVGRELARRGGAHGLDYEQDAGALAAIERARGRLEEWRVTGE